MGDQDANATDRPYAWILPRRTEEGVDLCISDGTAGFWEESGDDVTILFWRGSQ